jgi:hypothetical protein
MKIKSRKKKAPFSQLHKNFIFLPWESITLDCILLHSCGTHDKTFLEESTKEVYNYMVV